MIHIFLLKNIFTNDLLQVTTTRPNIMISDSNNVWYDFIVNSTDSDEYYNRGLKWAVPGFSLFDGNKFYMKNIEFTQDKEYNELVREEFTLLRIKRNALLSSCDWTQMNDAELPEDVKTEWKNYRHLLRNLPNTTVNPYLPDWPELPG